MAEIIFWKSKRPPPIFETTSPYKIIAANQNQEPIQVLLAFPPANFLSLLLFSMECLIIVYGIMNSRKIKVNGGIPII
mgnify:FL=1